MTEPLIVPSAIVDITVAFLLSKADVPPDGHEGVVLWIGSRSDRLVVDSEVPIQETGYAFFDVPLAERQRIARSLAGTGRIVLCQVHSHPTIAWHSPTDDERALPRHTGALSLVIPDQARRRSLLDGAALYEMSPDGRWLETDPAAILVGTE